MIKDLLGFEENYAVSSKGYIISKARVSATGAQLKEKVLKGTKHKKGDRQVKLVDPKTGEHKQLSLGKDMQEELFLNETVSDEKKSKVLTSTPVDHLKSILGINISEIADILQITRQAIYDWKSGKAIPSAKNQERINKLIAICKHWENENLGPIRHLIRQNIWNDYSLFDLLCKDELDEKSIYTYFDKIKTYMKALGQEKQQTKNIKEQYGFKQLSDKAKLEKLKKNSRKIG